MNVMTLKYIFAGVALSLSLHACYEEDALQPNPAGGGITFTFPEGDNAWDHELEAIAGEFGTKCIYKNFTLSDLTRTWTASSNSTVCIGGPLPDDRLAELYARFFSEHIFAHLDPATVQGTLPGYILFAYDFCSENYRTVSEDSTLVWHGLPSDNYEGLGFWSFCFVTGPHVNIIGTPWEYTVDDFVTARGVKEHKEMILKNILNRLVTKGVITVPLPFEEGGGLDYTTQITYGTANLDDENYYKRRGFPEQLRNLRTYVNPSDLYNIANAGPQLTFLDYIYLGLRYPREEIEANYADYPLVVQYYNIVVDHLLTNYGMDLPAMGRMPRALDEAAAAASGL